MCFHATETYPLDLATPRHARRFGVAQLSDVLGTDAAATGLIDDAEMVISELVTNAVNAGSSGTDLALHLHPYLLWITVVDNGTGRPVSQTAGAHDEHGRGLRIVAAMTRAWGVGPSPRGSRVWAELAVPTALNARLGWSTIDGLLPPTRCRTSF